MNRTVELDDLSVLARRGELSTEQQRELADALELSPDERFLHEAGRGFDLEASVLVGDEQLLARVTQRLGPKRVQRPVLPHWRFAAGVAAGLVLAATGALAFDLARAWLRPMAPAATKQAPATGAVKPAPVALAALSRAAPSDSVAPEPEPPAARPAAKPRPGTAPAEAALGEAPPAAPELFAAANRARSRGDTALAMALYRQLQSEHPGSTEARASRLSLGMLQLQRAEPAAALEQLRQYRAANPGGMTAEALFGEADAYRQLGRRDDERHALSELVARFPQSAYAVAAAKRLKQDP
jgi:TolA-binding protein